MHRAYALLLAARSVSRTLGTASSRPAAVHNESSREAPLSAEDTAPVGVELDAAGVYDPSVISEGSFDWPGVIMST